MSDQRRTGLPDVDPLIDAHEAEQGKLDDLITTDQAEAAVRAARRADLVAEQTAALRRWKAAKGLLTKAQKNGSAEKIAAARARVDLASAEFDRISETNIAELSRLHRAQLDSLGEIFSQLRRSWDADDAVTDALAQQRAARPTDDGVTP